VEGPQSLVGWHISPAARQVFTGLINVHYVAHGILQAHHSSSTTLRRTVLYARFDQKEKKGPTKQNDDQELRITFDGTSVTFKFKNVDDGEVSCGR
jgi:hypothetical protein